MCAVDAKSPCRLLKDPPRDGAWQMAVDEVLLDSASDGGLSASDGGRCSLRFYRWSRPTLSLGYFQKHAERAAHHASRDCALVRRQTGGGAIVHDRELTYSFVLPSAHPLAADPTRLYILVHEALIAVLNRSGVQAEICAAPAAISPDDQPFLCFQRRAVGDILIGDSKVCGSAQRRRRGAILQHGSLLLAQSPAAPELKGIRELSGKSLDAAAFSEAAAQELAARLRLRLDCDPLATAESDAARALVSAKYAAPSWNRRR